ncbi:MAG: hypothetical protein QM581_08285 [Pseudomonas sp.]
MLIFFVGMLVCGAIAQAGELSHLYFESRRRQLIARIRGTSVPAWPVDAGDE